MNEFKQELKQRLFSLVEELVEESVEKNTDELKNQYKNIMNSGNPLENYSCKILKPEENIKYELLELNGIKNEKARWLLLHKEFVEVHFKKLIAKVEGERCSVDKVETIMLALFLWLQKEKKISFNYDSEYTFYLPKKIFNTQRKITEFFDAVMDLYYGEPEKYLRKIKEMSVD